MAQLELPDAMNRLQANEERMDTFVNGNEDASYTTTSGQSVPSVQNFLKDQEEKVEALSAGFAADNGTTLIGGTWFGGFKTNLSSLASAIGASLLGYAQAGVGALFRSIQDRLRETVSADDYATLQQALDTGKLVRGVGGKTYPITAQLNIPANGGFRDISLSFSSVVFNATTKGTSASNIVMQALNVSNVTLRNVKIVGSVGVNSYNYAVAIRGVQGARLSGLDISGLNAGACVLVDSSSDVFIDQPYLHDCTIDRVGSSGQLTGIATDDFRISGVSTERLHVISPTIRRLLWTPAFLASYGPQTDGINIQAGTRNYTIIDAIIDEVGEGIDTWGEDGVIVLPRIDRALGYGIKFIHGASRNLLISPRISRSGLGGIVVAGSDSVTQNTDNNKIFDPVISNAGYDPTGYWSQPTYGIGINNDGTTYKATNTRVYRASVILSPDADGAFQSATSGVNNVYYDCESDGTATAEYIGAGAVISKRGQFGGVVNPTRYAQFDQDGVFTRRNDAPAGVTTENYRNWGINAAGNGHNVRWSYGSNGTEVAAAAIQGIYASDTWADAAHASTKYALFLARAGSLVQAWIVDPTVGIASAYLQECDLRINTAGRGLRVKEGTNAKQGVATLAGGTVTVSNTSVTANSRIMLTSQADGGTPGFLRVSARVAGTSFTITSSNAADTSTVAYQIFEPA